MRQLEAGLFAVLIAGCMSGQAPQSETTMAQACSIPAPESADHASLLVRVQVDSRHQYGADDMEALDKGNIKVDWWRQGQLQEKPLEKSGCASFSLLKDQVPIQVYARVPDKGGASCWWSGAERLETLQPEQELVVDITKACS